MCPYLVQVRINFRAREVNGFQRRAAELELSPRVGNFGCRFLRLPGSAEAASFS